MFIFLLFLFFASDRSGDVLLASCAQDAYIRLWRVSKEKRNAESAVLPSGEKEDEGEELKLTGNVFTVVDKDKTSHLYTVTLESVLMGKSRQLSYSCNTTRPVYIHTRKRLWRGPPSDIMRLFYLGRIMRVEIGRINLYSINFDRAIQTNTVQ